MRIIIKFANYSFFYIIFALQVCYNTMRITFEDTALEELYVNGATNSSKYRKLPQDLIKKYIKVATIFVQLVAWKICFASSRSTTRRRKETCKELMPYG